jgi:MFS family permease
MQIPGVEINDVNQAIQLALAPVFLLTGIAGMLNVMASRLARIIDRGRHLAENPMAQAQIAPAAAAQELETLEQRRHLASAAIFACTFAALLICTVIACLFAEVLLGVQLRWIVGLFFTGAILTLVVGLAYFLREVHMATTSVRFPARALQK